MIGSWLGLNLRAYRGAALAAVSQRPRWSWTWTLGMVRLSIQQRVRADCESRLRIDATDLIRVELVSTEKGNRRRKKRPKTKR